MQRPIPWFWIVLIGLLLLAPGLTARLFVDVLEGVTLLLVLGPLVLAGGGLLVWQWAKRLVTVCPACGTPSVGALQCPACGASLVDAAPAARSADSVTSTNATIDARDAVIDVEVRAVSDQDGSGPS
jgi:hypothetical protein